MTNDTEQTRRALIALHTVLVMLRARASKEQCSATMYEILDAAELMPVLIAQGPEGLGKLSSMLRDLAERFPDDVALALRRFEGED